MITGFENMTTNTLVKSFKEIGKGPKSTKAELIEAAMQKELDKRRVSPHHPVFSRLGA